MLQEVYAKHNSSFEVIYISSCDSLEDYNEKRSRMPWLAIPFSHEKRRARLLEHFEIDAVENQLVLLESSGATIYRDGQTLLSLAKQWERLVGNEARELAMFKGIDFPGNELKPPIPCVSLTAARALATKEIGNDPDRSVAWDAKQNLAFVRSGACTNHPERSAGHRGVKNPAITLFYRDRADEATVTQKAKLEQIEAEMVPLREAIRYAAAALATLRPQEKAEISSYIEEPEVPEEVQAALTAASQALKDAKQGVSLLKDERHDAFTLAQTVQQPPAPLKASVEAVCTLLELRPDFHDAQSRLLKTATFFADKLLKFNMGSIPRHARSRLASFLTAGGNERLEGPETPPLLWVAQTLRDWVVAVFNSESAAEAKAVAVEKMTVTAALQGACEGICDVFKIGGGRKSGDLRSTLMLAAAFSEATVADDATMDALHDEMQRVKSIVQGFQAYKDSLFSTFDEVTDLLNQSRFAGVTHLREHGRAIAADLKAMEQTNKTAAWHVAATAVYTALFVIAGKADAISESKDVLTVVATAPDKGGIWEEVLETLGKMAWKEPAKALTEAGWEKLSGARCSCRVPRVLSPNRRAYPPARHLITRRERALLC